MIGNNKYPVPYKNPEVSGDNSKVIADMLPKE